MILGFGMVADTLRTHSLRRFNSGNNNNNYRCVIVIIVVCIGDESFKFSSSVLLVLSAEDEDNICFSFCRLRLLRRQRSEALAKCHALLGRMLIGGYVSNASSNIN